MWRLASFAVFPIIGLALSLILPAHRKHQEEIEERMRNSEFIPYPYMHRITKVRIYKNFSEFCNLIFQILFIFETLRFSLIIYSLFSKKKKQYNLEFLINICLNSLGGGEMDIMVYFLIQK